MNQFLDELSRLCRDHLFEEKCLLVPNLRTGHQWLESVARSGQPVINVQIKTLRGLAMDLAGPELLKNGLNPLSRLAALFLMERVWTQCRSTLEGYLELVQPGTRFFKRLHHTLLQIRLAGKTSKEINPQDFEVETKGREIAQLLTVYEEELRTGKLVDEAGILRTALARLSEDASLREGLGIVTYPEDMEWMGLERQLIKAIPTEQKRVLQADVPGGIPELSFFRAVGEVNEVREVIRRCLEKGIPLDEVEILVTDPSTYIPFLFEFSERLKPDTQETGRETETEEPTLKMTFAEGIPARYSRPSQALSAWLEWTNQEQYYQPVLVSMIRDGLLNPRVEGISFARLADALQPLPIGHGKERYLPAIEWKLKSLDEPYVRTLRQAREEEPLPDRSGQINRDREILEVLKEMVSRLLEICPDRGASPLEIIRSAKTFLETCARSAGELDAYALNEFNKEIDQVIGLLNAVDKGTVFDAREWLGSLKETPLLGSSPRPGHTHVSSLSSGGHSGRPHTFILGMDEGRFPGGGSQDPLLLDGERHNISGELSTSAGRLRERVESFHRLLGRLRGKVTLSYPCRDLIQDRDLFPSPMLVALWNQRGNGNAATRIETISFAPSTPGRCLLETEWWLYQLTSKPENLDLGNVVGSRFLHFDRGHHAISARESGQVTEYDGLIGPHDGLDPREPTGPVLSANRLQLIGRCPLAYFFRYVLHIEPPEETALDPDVWLDTLAAGNLLHEIFREFMAGFVGTGRKPSLQRDWKVIHGILDKHLTQVRKLIPPFNEAAYVKQRREFETVVRVFLTEEEKYADEGIPLYLEASLGMNSQDPSTDLDTSGPVLVTLPNGASFRVCGRIDRIDRTPQGKILIWDYKTGSDYPYTEKDMPYKQGRLIQHTLYIEMVQSVLKEEVDGFGFFFPGRRARGNRITWKPEDLSDGKYVIQMLCQIAANGAFLGTDNENDCRYCDYRRVCSPIVDSNLRSWDKLKNLGNEELEPMRSLRGIEND